MEGLIFSEDVCRLCLWRSNKLLHIFSEEGELQGIPGKIGVCLPISVSRDDFLPKLICSRCIYKLETFSEFRNSCLRSEELLKRYSVHEPTVASTSIQVEPFQQPSTVVQIEKDVKIEVETEPVDVCLLPEPEETEMPNVEEAREVEVDIPVIESVNSITTEFIPQNAAIPTVPDDPDKKCKDAKKSSASSRRPSEETNSSPRRNIHNCKYCSKNFPSRLSLSQHLTSSNCLFRYTCRYCAKIFVTAENRLQHEKNHKDKKNFICGMCKQVFQSSFEVNVHAVQGCERTMLKPNRKTEKKKVASRQVQKNIKSNSQAQVFSCSLCSKVYRKNIHYQKHLRSCKRSFRRLKMQEARQKNRQIKEVEKMISVVDAQVANEKMNKLQSEGNTGRKPSRRKQSLIPAQDTAATENSNISPKASLLASLGLKEKPRSAAPKQELNVETDAVADAGRCSPDVIVVKEVVTVCDICRKIFTSEAGMLNHQSTVHNRNLTPEKIHTLMRVEI